MVEWLDDLNGWMTVLEYLVNNLFAVCGLLSRRSTACRDLRQASICGCFDLEYFVNNLFAVCGLLSRRSTACRDLRQTSIMIWVFPFNRRLTNLKSMIY